MERLPLRLAVGVLLAALLSVVAAPPPAVEIKGVTGKEDAHVNGLYRPTGTLVHGHPTYKQDGAADYWLSKDANGFWSVQPLAERGGGSGYMISSTRNVDRPDQVEHWTLWQGDGWKQVNTVSVKPVVETDASGKCALGSKYAGRFEAPVASGGRSAGVKDVRVELDDTTQGQWEVDGKLQKLWVVCNGTQVVLKDDEGATQFVGNINAARAVEGEVIQDGQRGGHFTLTPYTGPPLTPPNSSGENFPWTVCLMLLGFLFLVTSCWAATGSKSAKIRDLAYNTLSILMALFAAYVVNAAALVLCGRSIGAPLGTSSTTAGRFNFAGAVLPLIFVVGYELLNILAWKFQYSSGRLTVLQVLGGALVGILGAHCAADLYVEFAGGFAALFRDRGRGNFVAALILAVVAIIGFVILRTISRFVRAKKLQNAPVAPWPAPPTVELPVIAEKTQRSCAAPWATRDVIPEAPADPEPCSWQVDALDAEDEVASTVGAFVANQVLRDLPFLGGKEGLALLVACILAGVVVLAGKGKTGRVARILKALALKTVGLALVAAMLSWMQPQFKDNLAIAKVVSAVLLSLLSLLLLLPMAKLDKTQLRSGYGLLLTGDEAPGLGTAPFLVSGLGFLLAYAWAGVTLASLEGFANGMRILPSVPLLMQFLLSAPAGALLVSVWLWPILPQAEMSTEKHEEQIQVQQLQLPFA